LLRLRCFFDAHLRGVGRSSLAQLRKELAGNKPEAHILSAGGHGFGTRKQGTSSDHWVDEFYFWLEAHGLTTPSETKNSH
jgi:hypothetical protein